MGAFLAKTLFSAFGFNISPRTILKALLGVGIAVVIYLAYDKVRDHFQHIKDLESSNAQLTRDKTKLEGQVDDLKKINRDNASTNKATTEQRDAATNIGNAEAVATTGRKARYKEVRDVIAAIPPSPDPVDPLILRTLDSLWGPNTEAANRQ